MTIIFNQTKQKRFRSNLRKKSTEAEKLVWQKIRNRQLLGLKFRRQYGIEKFVVDFYCPELKYSVEIDGVTHSSEEELRRDKERRSRIEEFGITLILFTNLDVYQNLDGVLTAILIKAEELKKSPLLNPSSKWRGNTN